VAGEFDAKLVSTARARKTQAQLPELEQEPDDECNKMQWLLKYKSEGMSDEQILDFAKMGAALCAVATPCPAGAAATKLFSDPRDVCNLCNGVLDSLEPTPAFSACLSTINWACCPESSEEVRGAYDFCPYVSADGWKAETMSASDLALAKSWWGSAGCASRVGLPAPIMSAFTAAVPSLGVDEAMTALRQLKPAPSKYNLRLLGLQPAPPVRDYKAELAAAVLSLAATRSCDATLHSSARRLVDSVLCEQGQRC
jgi:hypothetical protein